MTSIVIVVDILATWSLSESVHFSAALCFQGKKNIKKKLSPDVPYIASMSRKLTFAQNGAHIRA